MSSENGTESWSHSVGERPYTVRVYERPGRRSLYIRTWDPALRGGRGGWRKRSLKHANKTKAKKEAAALYAELLEGDGQRPGDDGKLTLAGLFALYERHRTPQKGEREQKGDARRIAMWTRFLGGKKDPHEISRREWESFVSARSSGAIDARGEPQPEKKRREVGPRTVERDLRFLLAVLNWGKDWWQNGGYLLQENCCRGYAVPQEKNPARPIATDERVEAIRKVAPEVSMEVAWSGELEDVPSHLPELFELAVESGRRISAICQLRHGDLLLGRGRCGMIRWRAETDKSGRESVVPISPRLRGVLDRLLARRPGIGEAPLFPAPGDPSKPVSRYLASKWLQEAEERAKVEPHEGSLWHAYRRRWATVRKHLPAPDVAAAGGWAGPETLQRVYQQADPDTMFEVVVGGGELKEASGS